MAHDGSADTLFSSYIEGRKAGGGAHGGGVPKLRDLCLSVIVDGVLNLENAVFVLHFSRGHFIPQLEARAMKFIVASFKALREIHPHEDLKIALGAETLANLEKEQDDVDALTQKMRERGTVIDSPSEMSAPADTEAAAIRIARTEMTARARAEAEAAAKAEAVTDAEAVTVVVASKAEANGVVPPVKLATLTYSQLRAVIKAQGGEEPPMSWNKQLLVVETQRLLRGQESIPQEQLDAIVKKPNGRSSGGGAAAGGSSGGAGSSTPSRFSSLGGGGSRCDLCKKTVYPAERLADAPPPSLACMRSPRRSTLACRYTPPRGSRSTASSFTKTASAAPSATQSSPFRRTSSTRRRRRTARRTSRRNGAGARWAPPRR